MSKLTIVALSLLALAGCSSKPYLQAGSDAFSTPIPKGKAIVIIEAAARDDRPKKEGKEARMLVGFLKVIPGKTQRQMYENPHWDFATYPGATIPGFADKPFHGMHAYLLDPGTYAVIRCVYGMPEYDFCLEGVWLRDGAPAGMAYFEVGAGEVINTGKLFVSRTASWTQDHVYRVSVLNNHEGAMKYVSGQWPDLAPELQYRPMKFAY